MPRLHTEIHLLRFALIGAAAAALMPAAQPALACSDLPNICQQQQWAHQSQMNDYGYLAAQAAWESNQYNWDAYDRDPPASYDPMDAELSEALFALQMYEQAVRDRDLVAAELEKLRQDPRYQRYENGGWEYFQDTANPKPGEYCAAFFAKKDGFVMISGPGSGYEGAMLTFWGEDVPRPKKVERIRVTLHQTGGDPPQTVQAFNYIAPGHNIGAVALAVPTIDAALATMEDAHWFKLDIKGKTVAAVDWTKGHEARDTLKACVEKRTR